MFRSLIEYAVANEYTSIVVEYNEIDVFSLDQESGLNDIHIEFATDACMIGRVSLDEFTTAIEDARRRLLAEGQQCEDQGSGNLSGDVSRSDIEDC